ncbi:adenylosuccinate lyase family protein [Rhodobacteraceae bacterium N5(2021)]|uniref:Adenylosuccinate lyase family protein n=1 Tax=Gymnodinialimonas phycosphaerae TaxID=2841589 RepID=A0A975YGA9_9RHOB|nr:lyase family protein [Gymnodinialimonas phycosphaerae]MBY4891481.1 adenylosuccinate lyase family protein [Gymnodinialimonas phycosphaerae]
MSASIFDSVIHRDLFGDPEVARLLSDSAEVRAMMLVLGALAKVQGAAGVIPEVSGAFLHRATMEIQIDPMGLAGMNGVTIPGLVHAMREALEAPEHAHYLHWGTTSQDIQDTAQSLRLRQVLVLMEARLRNLLTTLTELAEAHAETPMAARTYGQVAVPSSFGALVASWGWPVIRLLDRLPDLRAHALCVSLGGAAGTASQLGPDPVALRRALAEALGLNDPQNSWHTERSRIIELAQWLAGVSVAMGKIGEDVLRLSRSDVGEVRIGGAGASSTMPQKQNPVAASALVALSRMAPAQAAVLSVPHGEARDGASWFTEWLTLPPLVAAAARASTLAGDVARSVAPDAAAMADRLNDPLGLIHAEALSFALTATLRRPDASAEVKRLTQAALATGRPLASLVAEAHPDAPLPPLTGPASLGQAPTEARAFVKAARALA